MNLLTLEHYLAVGAIMFCIGLIGFMTRRNLIVIFLCTELMFQAVAINLIAFGAFHNNLAGQAFVIFVLVIAASEASLALGLVILLFREKNTLDADAWRTPESARISYRILRLSPAATPGPVKKKRQSATNNRRLPMGHSLGRAKLLADPIAAPDRCGDRRPFRREMAEGPLALAHLAWRVGCQAAVMGALTLLFQSLGLSHHEPAPGGEKQAAAHESQGISYTKPLFNWIEVGKKPTETTHTPHGIAEDQNKNPSAYFLAEAAFFFDPLTVVMLCVVCGIGFFITVFAAGYMKGEKGYFRFFAYLGLFIFMMTCLVMGNNLIMLYLGWEGVGLSSYLLIGYYYEKPSAREAAKKAFLVNRIGDFGFRHRHRCSAYLLPSAP